MKKRTSSLFVLLVLIINSVSLTGCEIIGDIFKGGIVIGIIIAVLVLGLIIYIISKAK